jgi:tRNA threonylcarbamoyladenosine biosynthesis protein TsaB
LALVLDVPTVAVTSFEAYLLGLSVSGPEPYVVAIDSRRGPIFAQRFDASRQPIGKTLSEEPDTLLSSLPQQQQIVMGDAAARLKEFDTAGRLLLAGPDRITASMVAKAAYALGGLGIGRMPIAPLYLRPPDVTLPSKERA